MRGERDALPPCLFSLQGVPARARSSSPFVCSSREGTTRRGKKTFRVRVQCCIAPQGKQTEGGKEDRNYISSNGGRGPFLWHNLMAAFDPKESPMFCKK